MKAGKVKKQTQTAIIIKQLSRNKSAMVSLVVLVLLVLMAILAPVIEPYPYTKTDFAHIFNAPSWKHICGTDELGRDVLSRIMFGARYSLSLGILAVLLSTAIGMLIGAITGYFGGTTDILIMRCLDVFQSIPGLLLCVAIATALGSGFFNTVLALSIGNIPMTVRLLRGSVFSIRKQEYLEAATSINCSTARIILRHVLPNSLAPLIVSGTMGVGNTILTAAALSFIGLGVQPPTPEWGAMISAGRNYIRTYPYLLIVPGVVIMITVLALNILGDGLRDALDPKLKD
ncbi:MAG: ABC transporter permease [Clostridiales bacterium]|nr:ABC transporter permease [Clostridiales bacterium]